MAMQSYYSYGSQGVAESYRREESALNSSRFAVDQIEEPLSWRLQPQLHSPRLRDEQVVLSTTRRYHQHEPPLPYHPPPPPPPPAPLYAQPRAYNSRWAHGGPRYRLIQCTVRPMVMILTWKIVTGVLGFLGLCLESLLPLPFLCLTVFTTRLDTWTLRESQKKGGHQPRVDTGEEGPPWSGANRHHQTARRT